MTPRLGRPLRAAAAVTVLVAASVSGVTLRSSRADAADQAPSGCQPGWTSIKVPDGAGATTFDGANSGWKVITGPDPVSGLTAGSGTFWWDGTTWWRVGNPPPGTGVTVTALLAGGPTDLWAAGTAQSTDPARPSDADALLAHFDGTNWSVFTGAPHMRTANRFASVTPAGDGGLWLVETATSGTSASGWAGIVHYHEGVFDAPDETVPTPLAVASTGSTTAWAVGSPYRNTNFVGRTAAHRAGGTWTSATLPAAAPNDSSTSGDAIFTGVSGVTDGDVWAVGARQLDAPTYALADHWDGAVWSTVAVPDPDNASLDDVTAIGSSNVWASGTRLLHWNGRQWQVARDTGGHLTVTKDRTVFVANGGTVDRRCADPVEEYYFDLGGARSALGDPTGPVATVAGGRVQQYAHGAIYWSPATGAHQLGGPVLDRYTEEGGPSSALGFPVSDMVTDANGSRSRFEHGTISWDAKTGTTSVVLGATSARSGPPAASDARAAYRLAASDGGVFSFGAAPFDGSAGGMLLSRPIAGLAVTPSGAGYWLVASDGGVFAFGDAGFFGSATGLGLGGPIVGIASTPRGGGYWLVGSDGAVYAFGEAAQFGSMRAAGLRQPVVGMAVTPSGGGYWLVAADGGVFAFGDAVFAGSTGDLRLNRPIVGMASTPSGDGYWLVASDGGVFAFGDADFLGSTGAMVLNRPIVGMEATPTGGGYRLVATDGGVFSFGDAPFLGSVGGTRLNAPVVAMG